MSTQPSDIFCILDLIIDHIILHRKEEFDKAFITMLVLFVLASGCIAFSTILFYNALTTLLTKLYNNLTAMLQLFRLLTTNEEKAIVEADQATMNGENQSTEDAGEGEQTKGCLICAHVAASEDKWGQEARVITTRLEAVEELVDTLSGHVEELQGGSASE